MSTRFEGATEGPQRRAGSVPIPEVVGAPPTARALVSAESTGRSTNLGIAGAHSSSLISAKQEPTGRQAATALTFGLAPAGSAQPVEADRGDVVVEFVSVASQGCDQSADRFRGWLAGVFCVLE